LRLRYDEPLSNFGFELNLRRYSKAADLVNADDNCACALASTAGLCRLTPG
jgi:hypothetical protein